VRANPLTELGQDGFVAVTMKKRSAEFVLQLADCLGERGLGDVAGLGRTRKIPGIAHGKEIADLMHFHSF